MCFQMSRAAVRILRRKEKKKEFTVRSAGVLSTIGWLRNGSGSAVLANSEPRLEVGL